MIKSHGSADILAFENAILIAKKAVDTNVPERISKGVEAHLTKKGGV